MLGEQMLTHPAMHTCVIEQQPFITITPDTSGDTEFNIQSLAAQSVTAIFTSVNTVNTVTAQLKLAPNWKIFCIGGATRDALLHLFDADAIVGSAKNAILLAEKILADGKVNEVVFFCGNRRLNHLPDRLTASGIAVNEVVVYHTTLSAVNITTDYDGILFFSPSAAESFFSINTIPHNTILFSIGESTTAALAVYCKNKVLTSSWPSVSGVLDLVTDYYRQNEK
ncbi:MAG TPA: uroporphyrinogen-III synthase [Agriterribacter sp.]|nr:uroporphyrinogen-III synthase [Chitinophagaceae bacterium]HRP31944.1 uroporphyrinogen-III synthase [Agriterribacter sp.]